MRRLEAAGLGELVAEPDPLLPVCAEAVSMWNWLGGWQPERLPVYCALHGASDVELLTELLIVIRDHGRP